MFCFVNLDHFVYRKFGKHIIRFVNTKFFLTFAPNYGVAALFPQVVSKRESGVSPELYP